MGLVRNQKIAWTLNKQIQRLTLYLAAWKELKGINQDKKPSHRDFSSDFFSAQQTTPKLSGLKQQFLIIYHGSVARLGSTGQFLLRISHADVVRYCLRLQSSEGLSVLDI